MHAPEVDVAVIYQALQIILAYCCCSCCFTLFGCCCRQNRISMHAPENDAPGIYQAVAQNIPTHQAVCCSCIVYCLVVGCIIGISRILISMLYDNVCGRK
jgi:hypothetical protein